MFNKEFTKTRKLTISALCIALYVVVMMCTQSFAFGQYQIRIATALYALSAIFPFLVVPFGLANFVSNSIMGGLGPLDMLGGALVGIATSAAIVWLKSKDLPNYLIAVGNYTDSWLGCTCLAFFAAGHTILGIGFFNHFRSACFRHCWRRIRDRFGEEGSFDRNN
jgi:uncharacterized membrane protein